MIQLTIALFGYGINFEFGKVRTDEAEMLDVSSIAVQTADDYEDEDEGYEDDPEEGRLGFYLRR